MIDQDQIAAFLDDALDGGRRDALELELERDAEALRFFLDQRKMDCVLRSVLGSAVPRQRLKESILAAVSGRTAEQLQSLVLADTSGRSVRSAPTGFRESSQPHRVRVQIDAILQLFQSPKTAWLGFASAVVLIVAGAWLFFRLTAAPQVVVGEFAAVVGQPTLINGSGNPTLKLQPSTPIHLGDRLETGDADKAEIVFKDGTTLRLGFNTIVEIPQLKADSQKPSALLLRPPEIRLTRGQVWTKVQKLTNASQYAIRTEAATAVARGTEFGVKVSRSANATSQGGTNLAAVLTVKEGVVDFSNSFGSVQATAMTESTARADAKPTEPKRLQTLQVVRLANAMESYILSSQLDWPDAAERLAAGGGWAGLKVRNFPVTATGTNEIRIVHVTRNSPASTTGLRVGDVLLTVDGQSLFEASQISRAFLTQPDITTSLTLRRESQELSVQLTAKARSSLLPGPVLSSLQRAKIHEITRSFIEPGVRSGNRGIAPSRDPTVQGAAENNLGVILEADDAMGPAIRAYGRAVHAAPNVALYRFNLGLALRKIGSFERASEELEAAVGLAPDSIEARKRLAEVHSLLGDYDRALVQAESALQADLQDHGLWELKAQTLSKLGRHGEATLAARKAVETEPGCAVALGFLGGALYREGNLAEAEQIYRKGLAMAPFDALLCQNLGSLLSHLGQLPQAEELIRKAIELQPDFVLAYRSLGDVLGDGRQWAEAEAAFNRAAELDPEDRGVARDLGKLFFKQGRLSESEALYRKAIEASPHDPESYTGLGDVLVRERQYAQAEQAYRKAMELDPTNPSSYRDLAAFYRDALRDLAKAEELYRSAIQVAPGSTEAYNGLAQVRAMRGDLPEAEQLLHKARNLEPNASGIHNGLGEVFRLQGKLEEAAQSYRRALELAPDSPSPYNNLGIIYAMRGEFAEAEKMFRALLDLASKNARINPLNFLVNLAMTCDKQGKAGEAEKFYRQALELDPADPGNCNSFAWFLADRRINLDEALTLGRRAVQAAPNDPNFLDTLGWVYLQRGEFDEAEKIFKKALDAAGQNPPVAEIREHLKKVQEKREVNPQ